SRNQARLSGPPDHRYPARRSAHERAVPARPDDPDPGSASLQRLGARRPAALARHLRRRRPAHGRDRLQHRHGRRVGACGRSAIPGRDDGAGVSFRHELHRLRDDALAMRMPRRPFIALAVTAVAAVAAVLAHAQPFRSGSSADFKYATRPEAEFHFGRLAYATNRYAGSRGIPNPVWAVDWPLAEQHFVPAFTRYTRASTAPDSAI